MIQDAAVTNEAAVIHDEESFLRYFALFNAPDYAGFTDYYTDDIDFHLVGTSLIGPAAVVAVYREHHAHLKESCELEWLVVGDGQPAAEMRIAAELTVTFDVFADWPGSPLGPLTAGEQRVVRSWVHYDLRDGKIFRVRVTPTGRPGPPGPPA